MATITADRGKCQGYANCLVNAPDVFDVADDGKVDILQDSPPSGSMAEVREAVDSCPVRALTLNEAP